MKIIKNKQSGFTLIEIMLVTGFIALGSVGIYTTYVKTDAYMTVLEETKNADILREGGKSISENQGSYINLNNTALNDADITPRAMRDGTAANIVSKIAPVVTVTPTSIGAATNNAFIIQYQGIPLSYCSRFVTQAGNKFEEVRVNGTLVKSAANGNFDIDPSGTSTACNTNPGGATVALVTVTSSMNSAAVTTGALGGVPNPKPIYSTPFATEVTYSNPNVTEANKSRYWGNPVYAGAPNPSVSISAPALILGYNAPGNISFVASQKNVDIINAAIDAFYRAHVAANGGQIPPSFKDPMFKNDPRVALQVVSMNALASASGQPTGGNLPPYFYALIADFKTYIGPPLF
jgi:type II secretory pathway pseudopilin PulG